MLETYLTFAVVAVVVLIILWVVLHYVRRWMKISRYRRLLPYSDIEKDVENMSHYFNRSFVNGYILDYFKEDDNLKRARENCRAEGKRKPTNVSCLNTYFYWNS